MSDTVIPKEFKARQQYYMAHWGTAYPYSWRKNYPQINAAFNLMQYHNIQTVVELGCNDGGLAVELMRDLPYPLKWTGYDFLSQHLERGRWHPSYTAVLLEKHLWEMEIPAFDVFVASHVLEHLYPEEIQSLAQWLSPRAKFLVFASPLGTMSSQEHAQRSGHILTKGALWISDVLQSVGFRLVWETGRWFGWFQKK